jgi:hypothetical protein
VTAWQERNFPQYAWASVLANIAAEGGKKGIKVLDYTSMLESTTKYYKDVYHLN